MVRPVEDGKGKVTGTVRAHYQMLVGKGRTEYAEKLKAPPLPRGFGYLWAAHQEMSEGRSPGGMGPSRLTWGDVAAWQDVSGVRLTSWEAETLFAMDAALVGAATRED